MNIRKQLITHLVVHGSVNRAHSVLRERSTVRSVLTVKKIFNKLTGPAGKPASTSAVTTPLTAAPLMP